LLDRALALPERMAEREWRLFVVALDEFEEVERLGGEPLLKRMRAIIQRQCHTAHLFLGSRPSVLRALFGRQSRAFFRFADPLTVPPIPREAWRGYAERKLSCRGVHLLPEAADFFLDKTEGHPWETARAFLAAYFAALGAHTDVIDLDLAALPYRHLMNDLADVFVQELQELDGIPQARAVLDRIARREGPYTGSGQHPERVRRALDALVERCILRKVGRGQYAFEEPLLREHLRSAGWG